MKPQLILILFIFLGVRPAFSQTEPKKLNAVRTDKNIKIDGILDDEAWKAADIATGFIEFKPVPGRRERPNQNTEIRILYDDAAIYVAARMNEVNPDSIARQIVPRDRVGNADFIGVIFDTYLDKINGNGFYITAAGSQYDAKYSQMGNEDDNWNAVWFSEVKIDKNGWSAEFKIPYSALRFSNKDIQTWGLNFTRRRQKSNEQFFWNAVDPKVSGFINQEGELTNIQNIKAPLRLSFSPYVSGYLNNYPHNTSGIKNTTSSFNGGMDVKYGINNAFTLDMTLVPDFGQVQSDSQILNLTPFEVKFDERRQFFTEGTELFNKGNLFYSRRIGSFPSYKRNINNALRPGEIIVRNPTESKLINATKVSGRMASGLGIGVFNAVTNRMNAMVRDNSGNERFIEAQPLTNYNIMVLDQSLKNNSSVTFLNTNVLREGTAYDANVSAFLFSLNDKKNKYFIKGGGKTSYLTSKNVGQNTETGLSYSLSFGRQSGNFMWSYGQELTDSKYNPTDLGFFNNNNFFDHNVNLRYNIYKPGKWYNQIQTSVYGIYSERFQARSYQSFTILPDAWIQFKNFWTLYIGSSWQAAGRDFYEPRVPGRIFKSPSGIGYNLSVNSNRSKKYFIGGFYGYKKRDLFGGREYGLGFWQTYRINDKLSLRTEIIKEPRFNYAGWAASENGSPIFSRYDRRTVEAVFSGRYTFSPLMGVTLRARHYWSDRNNLQFYSLLNNGTLADYPSFNKNVNQNYNVFNVDLVYTWQFSPGSEISLAWKDAAEEFNNVLKDNFNQNLGSIMRSPQNNSLSLKVLYYIDYLQLRKKKK